MHACLTCPRYSSEMATHTKRTMMCEKVKKEKTEEKVLDK